MDDMNYSSDVEYESDTKKGKGFKITRGMLILFVALIVVILVIIIIVASSGRKKNRTYVYSTKDFTKLEERMVEEASNYVAQERIELTSEERRIDLSKLLVQNGGSISPDKFQAAKICKGYVLASKPQQEVYKAFIKCESGNTKYTTTGYISNNKTITTTTTAAKDTTPPVITIIGQTEIYINLNTKFEDPYVKAIDDIDGDITSKVKTSGTVDTTKVGTYELIYTVEDKAKNMAKASRKVFVTANTTTAATTRTQRVVTTKHTTTQQIVIAPPTITLKGKQSVTVTVGSTYKDAGYYAKDCYGRDITSSVIVKGSVNTTKAGTYFLTFSVTDRNGNTTTAIRKITVEQVAIKLKSISITPANEILSKGGTKQYTVQYNPANAPHEKVTWSVTGGIGVVTINSNGLLTAKKVGSATIKATTTSGISATTSVTVH